MTNNYKTRADQLGEQRALITRLADTLTDLAVSADRRKHTTDRTRALDSLDTLTALAQNVAAQFRQLLGEVNNTNQQGENNQ